MVRRTLLLLACLACLVGCTDDSDGPDPVTDPEEWEWSDDDLLSLPDEDPGTTYDDLRTRWALLVCGSRGWFNYRHQTDVLSVYHLLRRHGYDDNHIILIASPDEVALDSRNTRRGTLCARPDGDNLLCDVQLDYASDTLTAADITAILRGEPSAHLPTVLDTDSHANVFFYWSGHGTVGHFLWNHSLQPFTASMLAATLSDLYAHGRYRKLLLCAEACYAGSVTACADTLTGVLAVAAADSLFTSPADVYDPALGVWLSDRFTNALIETIDADPTLTYCDLYHNLVRTTRNPHITLSGYSRFGNLHTASLSEFFEHAGE